MELTTKEVGIVSIHASAQEATTTHSNFLQTTVVSIHASAQEATFPIRALASASMCFNPRLRAGGDTFACQHHVVCFVFQSTPPRRRRLSCRNGRSRGFSVSIHASAQEATILPVDMPQVREVSIHASAQEATTSRQLQNGVKVFQSTPPRRRRHQLVSPCAYCAVSIHASAQEATNEYDVCKEQLEVSIHASAQEATD